MFNEVKAMIQNQVSGDEYDEQIIMWIEAAVLDLTRTAAIVLPGEVHITRTKTPATTSEPEKWTITDTSTLMDRLVISAIATYVCMNIGNPPNYEQLARSYRSLKGSMEKSRHYTSYDGVTTT